MTGRHMARTARTSRRASRRNTAGESITETLVAMLVVSLGMLTLTTAIVRSAQMTLVANSSDEEIQTQSAAAARQDGEGFDGTIEYNASGSTGTVKDGTQNVTFYGGDKVSSYKYPNTDKGES